MSDIRFLYRSAITGRFVSKRYAQRYPHLTVRERPRPTREPYIKPVYPNPETEH
jgi:hypothetical protein